MATKTVENTVLKTKVDTGSPSLQYSCQDRQIELYASSWTIDGEEIGSEGRASFYSVMRDYFNGNDHSLESLRALEDCFLFGLTEIAKQRAKLEGK